MGALWDAALEDGSESLSTMDREIRSRSQLRADAGIDPLVWLTTWFPKRMWPVEAIPWASSLRAVDLWFPEWEA
jgi:hypothetical protein